MSDDRIALSADDLEALTAAASERHTRGPAGMRYFRSEASAAAAAQADAIAEVLVASTRRVRTPEGARVYGQPIGTVITKDMVPRAAKAALTKSPPTARKPSSINAKASLKRGGGGRGNPAAGKSSAASKPPNKAAAIKRLPESMKKETARIRAVLAQIPEKDRERTADAVVEEFAGHMATSLLPRVKDPKHKAALHAARKKGKEAHNVLAAISALYPGITNRLAGLNENYADEYVSAGGAGRGDFIEVASHAVGHPIPNPFWAPMEFIKAIGELIKQLLMMKVTGGEGLHGSAAPEDEDEQVDEHIDRE